MENFVRRRKYTRVHLWGAEHKKPEDTLVRMAGLIILFIVYCTLGYLVFPGLFVIQRKLGLPVPDLEKQKFHLHHSLLGLLLVLLAIYIGIKVDRTIGVIVGGVGLGILIHHEHSEPHLKGVERFIHWRR